MNESDSIEKIDTKNLTDQTKLRLNEISEIWNYFNQEIKQRKLTRKNFSKQVAAFDYIYNILVVLSATTGRVSIISFTNVIGAPVGIANLNFTLIFFFNYRNN